MSKIITRRDLLKSVGLAAAAAPAALAGADTGALAAEPVHAGHGTAAQAAAPAAREVFQSLTATEADVLDAIVARLIPSDELGPGAREARAVDYIDRALGGALASSREAYRAGLAALDNYSRSSRGKPFLELAPTEQDSVLIDVEFGTATAGMGFSGSAAAFFNMVKSHTWQGTFGDPYYGGNANFIGWDLIRYPGVRTQVSAADQQALERDQLTPARRSAYETDMFNKATVRVAPRGGTADGDQA